LTSSLAAILVASLLAPAFAADLPGIASVATRDRKIVRKFSLQGQPAGVAISGGVLYVGLAARQSVVAIDPSSGEIVKEVVLDDPDFASTKELVTLRPTADGRHLVVANGTDESVTILSLPDLAIVREITMEGEVIRDAIPDPGGRYLYVVGRSLHVFDATGETVIRRFSEITPMVAALSPDGSVLAVIGSQRFPGGPATVAMLVSTARLEEVAREPLQTDREIRAALFGAGNSLVVLADDWLAEKSLAVRPQRQMKERSEGKMELRLERGDLVSSEKICLPKGAGPQIAAASASGAEVIFVERRCGVNESLTAAKRNVRSVPLSGYQAYAIAADHEGGVVWATDPAGFLTGFRAPGGEKK
jgi:hypothetical protein